MLISHRYTRSHADELWENTGAQTVNALVEGLVYKHIFARVHNVSLSLPHCQERRMMHMHPYILNINEDAQLSGVVKLFIQEGEAIGISLSLGVRSISHPLLQLSF